MKMIEAEDNVIRDIDIPFFSILKLAFQVGVAITICSVIFGPVAMILMAIAAAIVGG